MKPSPNRRMAWIAILVLFLDQVTKQIVLRIIGPYDEHVVIDGFFKFVNWGNTGAAWSMFHNQNRRLAVISAVALCGLFYWRRHFDTRTVLGQASLGLIFGGIIGNLIDRIFIHHVVDFLRFYIYRRGGEEIGFPAFNIADSAICIGVGLLFILSWRSEATVPAEAI